VHVVATAGHVDHGKSTLVRALTGRDPDRLAEERRRGLTIELGYAWTALPDGTALAFVDVPGHQRFLATMLAGVGPVPAALLVVAADEGWRRQTGEHVAALEALGVEHTLVAVTRSDLADPAAAAADVRARLAGRLPITEVVAVSGRTGQGLPQLLAALGRLVTALPDPDPAAAVRLWVDRVFTVAGAGTVVTGTLRQGTVRVGDALELAGRPVRVRGLQSLEVPHAEVAATARVAVALRGVERDDVGRGDALLTPGAWRPAAQLDVRLVGSADRVPGGLVLHVGAAAVPVRTRPLAPGTVRLTLDRPLPLRAGDRLVLRDPGEQRVLAGAVVLDPDPPALRRRGAARARAAALQHVPDAAAQLARRGSATRAELAALGVLADGAPDPAGSVAVGGLLVDGARWAGWLLAVPAAVLAYLQLHPDATGVPRDVLVRELALPSAAVLDALLAQLPGLHSAAGRVAPAGRGLPPAATEALTRLHQRWAERPFDAPGAEELVPLGLTRPVLGALVDAGVVLRLPGQMVLPPDAGPRALALLGGIPQPFTASAARQALGTSRRVALPLLEHLDARRLTLRAADGTRRLAAVR